MNNLHTSDKDEFGDHTIGYGKITGVDGDAYEVDVTAETNANAKAGKTSIKKTADSKIMTSAARMAAFSYSPPKLRRSIDPVHVDVRAAPALQGTIAPILNVDAGLLIQFADGGGRQFTNPERFCSLTDSDPNTWAGPTRISIA